jgi:hypothetical protein
MSVSDEQRAKLEGLLAFDASVNMTRFAWLKAMPLAPKGDHVRELLDRLRQVRDVGLQPDLSARIQEERGCGNLSARATRPMPISLAAMPPAAGVRFSSRPRSISRRG